MALNLNPQPQTGAGAYGAVPGVLGLPTNIYSQVNTANPGLNVTGNNAANVISDQVKGVVIPDVQNLIQNKAASLGVSGGTGGGTGAPGSFISNNWLASLGRTSMDVQNEGVNNYLKFLTGVGGTMTDPNLAFTTEQQNSINAAAPTPSAAAQQEKDDFDRYMNMVKGGSQKQQQNYFVPKGVSSDNASSGQWNYTYF